MNQKGLVGLLVGMLLLCSALVSAQTCSYATCDRECTQNPLLVTTSVLEGYLTFNVYYDPGTGRDVRVYEQMLSDFAGTAGAPVVNRNPGTDAENIIFHPDDGTGKFYPPTCYMETDAAAGKSYYIQSNITTDEDVSQDRTILLSCSSETGREVTYDDQKYCEEPGCGGKYSDKSIYAVGETPIGADDLCCGDDPDDDPDDYHAWCTLSDTAATETQVDAGCRVIGDYYEAQNAGMRDWNDGGKCCGDDIAGDASVSDCLRFFNDYACLNQGGVIEPKRYKTELIDSSWMISNEPPADTMGTEGTIDYCNFVQNQPTGEVLYDSYDGLLSMRKRCEIEEGASIDGSDGIIVPPGTQPLYQGTFKTGPFFTKGSNWSWLEANAYSSGNIYFVPCAGYSVMVTRTGGDHRFVSCTNQPLHPGIESVFAIGDLTQNVVENPHQYELGEGNPNILCHSNPDYLGIYQISECCGDTSCQTCLRTPNSPGEDCGTHTVTHTDGDHYYETGERITQHSDHTPERSIVFSGDITSCQCYEYAENQTTETCYKTEANPSDVTALPLCDQNTDRFHCTCSTGDGCTLDKDNFYCLQDDQGGYDWHREEYIESFLTQEAFYQPLDVIKFGNCDYTPMLADLALDEPGEMFYCSPDAEWLTDLDIDDDTHEATCDAYGDNTEWTGTRCCGETEDYPEFYSDINGSCWRSSYQAINTTVVDNVHQAGDHTYKEILTIQEAVVGCAIDADDPAVSLKTEDLERGILSTYSSRVQNDKKTDWAGSRGPNIMDRRLFHTLGDFNWASRDTNDWILSLQSESDTQLVTDLPFCSTVDAETTIDPNIGQWYCAYNETWQEGNNSHLSFIEWPLQAGTQAGCCDLGQCWTGTECISPNSGGGTQVYPMTGAENSPKYICIDGDWESAIPKYTWDGLNSNFTSNMSLCLVDPNGNSANNMKPEMFSESRWRAEAANENPAWIGDGQFILDHLCENGTWVSRTKIIANTFIEYAEDNDLSDYTIFCDSWDDALNNVHYNLTRITHSVIPHCTNLIQDNNDVFLVYIADKDDFPGFEDQGMNCNTHCKDGAGQNIPCTNAFCVLTYDEGSGTEVAFGVSLNQIFEAADYPFKDVLTDVGSCSATRDGSFHSCSGDGAFYNPMIESVIYSKDSFTLGTGQGFFRTIGGFFSGFLTRITSFFKTNPVQDTTGYDFSYVKRARNFDRLYISERADKRVEAIEELDIYDVGGGSPKHFVYATFTGFSQDVCTSLQPYIDADNYYSECTPNGNQYVLAGFAGSNFLYQNEDWIALTAELRLDGTTGTGQLPSCTLDSQLSSNGAPCMCGGEAFPGGSEPGAFGSTADSYCCSNGPCAGTCDTDGTCPSSCNNPLVSSCSCVDAICSGRDKTIYPLRNGEGFFELMPQRCRGDFTIDVSGASHDTSCSTGWESVATCENPDGGSFPGCGQASFKITKGEIDCVQDLCTGYNSNITSHTDYYGTVNSSSICCDGAWEMDFGSDQNLKYCCQENNLWDPLSANCDLSRFYFCDGTGGACGNGIVEPGEECDNPGDLGCVDCALVPCGPNTVQAGMTERPCVCSAGFDDCDGDLYTTGCEVTLGSETDCMSCGDLCADGLVCLGYDQGCDLPWCIFDDAGVIGIHDFDGPVDAQNPICRLPCE